MDNLQKNEIPQRNQEQFHTLKPYLTEDFGASPVEVRLGGRSINDKDAARVVIIPPREASARAQQNG